MLIPLTNAPGLTPATDLEPRSAAHERLIVNPAATSNPAGAPLTLSP
jgi:hypothetical protein